MCNIFVPSSHHAFNRMCGLHFHPPEHTRVLQDSCVLQRLGTPAGSGLLAEGVHEALLSLCSLSWDHLSADWSAQPGECIKPFTVFRLEASIT